MADIAPVQYAFECDALSAAPAVRHVSVEELITSPYSASLDLRIADPSLETEGLVGADGVLRMTRAGIERRVCGVIVEVEETRGLASESALQLRLAPALELARYRRNTRMFQQKTVPEILEVVLGEALAPHGREARLDLEQTYEPREYCLQYQETDLQFVQRLMEEEGIGYSFDHAGEVELMRLTDRNAAFEPVLSLAGDAIGRYAPHNLVTTGEEPVHRFEVVLQERTTSIALADRDWTRSGLVVTGGAADPDPLGRTRESYAHGLGRSLQIGSYDEGVRRYQKDDAATQAPLRREAAVATARVGHGVSRMIGMQPGSRFSMSGHPSVGVDGDWIVTRVVHSSVPAEAVLDGGVQGEVEAYHNRFECIPLETVYRPARTARKPRIDGIQTAIVTGPSGEEVHVDAHGRIKVQFYWDRENPADETSSCWVRVKQEWAGPGWGFWWVPRIGMEVVVHFVDGDPDRPLVTGAAYDGVNPTPYPLPDDKTKSTIKSNSSLGGDGFNEVRFEDKAGSEEIYVHAQKDYNEVVENDHITLVHHDQTNTVDNDQTQTVDANQTERVDVDQTMTVGANRTVHVKGNYDETVDGTETRTVSGDVTEDFAANETRTVSGSVTETIGGNETRDIGANLTETIGASHTREVSGSETLTISGAQTRTATGGIKRTTPASESVSVAGSWTVTAPAGIKIVAPAGITLTIPGGVTRADSFWDLAAGTGDYKGQSWFELFAAKVGIVPVNTGLWLAIKFDVHVAEFSGHGTKLVMQNLKAGHAAIKKRLGGMKADTEATRIATPGA